MEHDLNIVQVLEYGKLRKGGLFFLLIDIGGMRNVAHLRGDAPWDWTYAQDLL